MRKMSSNVTAPKVVLALMIIAATVVALVPRGTLGGWTASIDNEQGTAGAGWHQSCFDVMRQTAHRFLPANPNNTDDLPVLYRPGDYGSSPSDPQTTTYFHNFAVDPPQRNTETLRGVNHYARGYRVADNPCASASETASLHYSGTGTPGTFYRHGRFHRSSQFTIETWLKTSTRLGTITGLYNDQVPAFVKYAMTQVHIDPTTGAARAAVSLTGRPGDSYMTRVQGTTNIADGQWHQVVFTMNHDERMIRLYVDGQEEDSATKQYDVLDENMYLRWGQSPIQNWDGMGAASASQFDGEFAYLAAYPTELDAQTINNHWASRNSTAESQYPMPYTGS